MSRYRRQFATLIGALFAACAFTAGCTPAPKSPESKQEEKDFSQRDRPEDAQPPAFPYEEPSVDADRPAAGNVEETSSEVTEQGGPNEPPEPDEPSAQIGVETVERPAPPDEPGSSTEPSAGGATARLAALSGSDPQTDVAVLKTDKRGLIPAKLATHGVEQGDIVLAVGSPFRYAFSLSQGIVSATGRRMGILGPQGYENFIQTDAAINPGNSGGPLTNARGEVVGMSTAIASRSGVFAGIGFAIPAEMIRDVADELIRKGKVERGYLGVMISDNRRLLASFGADRGVLVEDVVGDGPADRAGLTSGDVITAIAGQPVESATTLRRQVARTDPGETVQLSVLRDGQEVALDVTLEQQPVEESQADRSPQLSRPAPDDAMEAEALVKLGFERLQAITPEIARQYDLDPSWGVLVLEVRQFSAAAIAGLRRGHIITHALGQKVTDVDELRGAVEGQDLNKGVRMRVRVPGGPARFVLLSLED